MDSFALLDLPRDADEREIKRAYSRLLKVHRPDTDPVGFQRINEAYKYCLEACRHRALVAAGDEGDEDDAEDEALQGENRHETQPDIGAPRPLPSPHWRPGPAVAEFPDIPAHEPQEDAFDVDAFIDALVQAVGTLPPDAISRHLAAIPALYSLQLKHELCPRVAHAMLHVQPLPPPDRLRVVLAFFGLDTIGFADGWAEQAAHHALERAEAEYARIEAEQAAFNRFLAETRSPKTRPVDRMLQQEATTPRAGWRRLLIMLVPSLPSRVRELIDRVENISPDAAKDYFDADARWFWERATDQNRIAAPRLSVIALRLFAIFLCLLPISGIESFTWTFAIGGGWLIGALARALALWINPRLTWNPRLVVIGTLLGGTLAILLPVFAAIMAWVFAIRWAWPHLRNNVLPALVALVLGALVPMPIASVLAPESQLGVCSVLTASALVSGLGFLFHDVGLARRHGCSVEEARAMPGYLGRLSLIHMVLALSVFIVALSIAP